MSQQNKNITFAYWVPNVSGGLVVSNIEQRTDWSYDYNVRWWCIKKYAKKKQVEF